jgi:PEP-CTERM motif-containing protein
VQVEATVRRVAWVLAPCVLGAMSLAPAPARADAIEFTSTSTTSAAGFIAFNGTALTGAAIPITSVSFPGMGSDPVSGFNCGSRPNFFPCGGLGFTTGSLISTTSTSYTFNGGGVLTVNGEVPGDSHITTLVSADFSRPVTVTQISSGSGGRGSTWQLSGPITIWTVDPSVLALFPGVKLTDNGAFGSFVTLRFRKSTGVFLGTPMGETLSLTGTTAPEPSSLLLMGSGLTALGIWLRRRKK